MGLGGGPQQTVRRFPDVNCVPRNERDFAEALPSEPILGPVPGDQMGSPPTTGTSALCQRAWAGVYQNLHNITLSHRLPKYHGGDRGPDRRTGWPSPRASRPPSGGCRPARAADPPAGAAGGASCSPLGTRPFQCQSLKH